MFNSLARRLKSSMSRRSSSRRPSSRKRLRLEALENRIVPTVSVAVDPGTLTLSLKGDNKNETVIILETPGTTSVNIDNNGDGTLDQFLDSYVFMGGIRSFNHFNIDLGGGNDKIEFRAMHDLTSLRDFQISDTKGDNSFTFDANGFAISSQLNVQFTGGKGDDAVTVQLNKLDGANVNISLNQGAGNDEFSMLSRGDVVNSAITVNQVGGDGNDAANIFYQPEANYLSSSTSVTFDGGRGNDGFNTSINSSRITGGSTMNFSASMGDGSDVLNYRLNSHLADAGSTGSAALHANLGDGNDTFTSTLGYDAGLIVAGSQAVFQVDGGAGDDFFFVAPVTFNNNDLVLDGDVQYYLNGGTGRDNITFATTDILGNTNHALVLGSSAHFVVQIDGGGDADKIAVVLNLFPTAPGLTNRAVVTVLAGAGNDTVNFTGAASPLAPNLGSVTIDGGTGTDTYVELLLTPFNRTVINFEL